MAAPAQGAYSYITTWLLANALRARFALTDPKHPFSIIHRSPQSGLLRYRAGEWVEGRLRAQLSKGTTVYAARAKVRMCGFALFATVYLDNRLNDTNFTG